VPLGIILTRQSTRRVAPGVVAVANTGQAIPTYGLVILFGTVILAAIPGSFIAVIAVIIYSILPVLRNTMVGMQQVDPSVIEAARGMGMSKAAVLARIEMPLAIPVIMAGVRVSLVLAVGSITLATFIGGGALGNIIETGITTNAKLVIVTGSVLTAVLALIADWAAGIAEDVIRPRGL
jgi:osmoprotectant transport system permease protein